MIIVEVVRVVKGECNPYNLCNSLKPLQLVTTLTAKLN